MRSDILGGNLQGPIREAEEAIARFGNDLARFSDLIRRAEIARFGKDLALFNQLLALLSEHMATMRERIDSAHLSNEAENPPRG